MANSILVLSLTLALGPGLQQVLVLGRQAQVSEKYYDAGGEGETNKQSKIQSSSWNENSVAEFDEDEDFSPWELHIFNDLMIELSLIRCSKIDKRDARMLKRAISLKLSEIYPEDQQMNPTFYRTYRKLEHCMEFLTERHGMNEIVSTTKEGSDRSMAESQPDVAEVLAPTVKAETTPRTTPTTPGPTKASTEKGGSESDDLRDKPLAGLERIFVSAMKWLKNLLENNHIWSMFDNGGNETERMKRSAVDYSGSSRRREAAGRGNLNPREEHEIEGDLQKLFAMFGRILINSCPKKDKPSIEFTRRSIHEIVLASVSQPYGVLSNSQLVGPASKLWKQVKECVAISSARNPTDAELVMDESASRGKGEMKGKARKVLDGPTPT